jgi:hypothetical protein
MSHKFASLASLFDCRPPNVAIFVLPWNVEELLVYRSADSPHSNNLCTSRKNEDGLSVQGCAQRCPRCSAVPFFGVVMRWLHEIHEF